MNLNNYVRLTGRLGADPQIRTMEDGRKFARFTLAVQDLFVNRRGESISQIQWHQIVAWGSIASIVEKNLIKGTLVIIEGKLINRNWTDKEGTDRCNTEISASEITIKQM